MGIVNRAVCIFINNTSSDVKKISPIFFLKQFIVHKGYYFNIIKALHERYGESVLFTLFGKTYFFTQDVNYIQSILAMPEEQWSKNSFIRELNGLVGEGLVTSVGEHWKSHRRLIQPFFNGVTVKHVVKNILDEVQILFNSFAADIKNTQKTIRVDTFFKDIILQSTTKVLFGIDTTKQNKLIAECLQEYLEYTSGAAVTGFVKKMFQGFKVKKKLKILNRFILDVIHERKKDPNLKTKVDFISYLLKASAEKGVALSTTDIRDELMTLLYASHETTGAAMGWFFYHMAYDLDSQNKLASEAIQSLGDLEIKLENLAYLKYSEASFKEILRLYPPAWCLGRECKKPVQIKDLFFNAHDNFFASVWFMHRSEKYWKNAEDFIPERFLTGLQGVKSEVQKPKSSVNAWMPFGYGTRGCIGKSFAMLEAPYVVSLFLKQFQVTPIYQKNIQPIYHHLMRSKDPLLVHVQKRIDKI